MSYPISKVIHFIWFQGFSSIPEYMAKNPDQWKLLNPDYEILRWDFDSLAKFIREYYPAYYRTWNELPLVIKKCDMARLLLIHYFGGIYLDCDLVPLSGLDRLFLSRKRYCQHVTMVRTLPEPYPTEVFDFSSPELILSREHRPIDSVGFGVANGVIMAKPQSEVLKEFLDSRYLDVDAPVLHYLGPHALTRFIRRKGKALVGKTAIISPHYFLWEDVNMDHAPPHWCISKHMGINHWGDSARADWWNVA